MIMTQLRDLTYKNIINTAENVPREDGTSEVAQCLPPLILTCDGRDSNGANCIVFSNLPHQKIRVEYPNDCIDCGERHAHIGC